MADKSTAKKAAGVTKAPAKKATKAKKEKSFAEKHGIKAGDKGFTDRDGTEWLGVTCRPHDVEGFDAKCAECTAQAESTVDHARRHRGV